MKIYFDSIGCRLNQAEIESLASQFRRAGHSVTGSAEGADLVIINTCAVTAAAASDSREKSRQAYHAGAKQIVLTGCWATLEPAEALNLPGVMRVVTNARKSELVSDLLEEAQSEYDAEPVAREPLPGIHRRTRAFIKAQDGCDNFCTFCVTRIARGQGVSVPMQQVIRDVELVLQGGAKEIVLSGVHLGSWGNDLKNGTHLRDLIQAILDETSIERVRLSSVEPWDLERSFFELWQDSRMCPHIHFPLQSGSAAVLKRMGRNTTPDKYRALVELARDAIPNLALTTDIIVGFPMENDEEFGESLEFVREMEFAGGHVFKYSAREGTAAARLSGRVHGKIAGCRSRSMRGILQESAEQYARGTVGRQVDVLWESTSGLDSRGWRMHGLSDNYLKVSGFAPENRWNCIDRVKVISFEAGQLEGEIIQE